MALIEPFQFETTKLERARLLVVGALWLNVILSWALPMDAAVGSAISGPALLFMAPSIAALVTLLRQKELDGAKLAQVVAWGYLWVITIFGGILMILSVGGQKSGGFAVFALMATLLAVQITILAAVRWGRSEVTLWRAFARYVLVVAVGFPILLLGYLSN